MSGVAEKSVNYTRSNGFKPTNIGEIPSDWNVTPLSRLGNPVRGGSPRPAGDTRFFDGTFIPWLTVAGLTNISDSTLYVTSTATQLTEAGAERSRRLSSGTLIIANSGATLGVAKILGLECCANDGIAALLNLSREVSIPYLVHFINSRTEYLRAVVATGNGQPNLNTDLIGRFLVPLPPTLAEQEAIASALGDADALIESLEQLLAKKRLIKQGAMQELLTGDWPCKIFSDLFKFSGGYSASRDDLGRNGYLYLHYGDIHGSERTFIDVEADSGEIPRIDIPLSEVSPASLLEHGDVVFVDASEDVDGTNKHVVIENPEQEPFISGLHTIVAKRVTSEVNPRYMRYCFQTRDIKEQFRFYAVGTKVFGVSKSSIAKITLRLPPPDKQAEFAATLDAMEQEIELIVERVAKARQIKQAMMQQLLTGRIRLV